MDAKIKEPSGYPPALPFSKKLYFFSPPIKAPYGMDPYIVFKETYYD
jgi:hypothetical protein